MLPREVPKGLPTFNYKNWPVYRLELQKVIKEGTVGENLGPTLVFQPEQQLHFPLLLTTGFLLKFSFVKSFLTECLASHWSPATLPGRL